MRLHIKGVIEMQDIVLPLWENYTDECIVITDLQRNIIYKNTKFNSLLSNCADCDELVNSIVNTNNNDVLIIKKERYLVRHGRNAQYRIIVLSKKTKELNLENEVKSLTKIAEDYEMLFQKFGDKNIYVTDGKGVTTWAGSYIAQTCGVTQDTLVGKSVFELEEQRIFFPSVIAKVLRSYKEETSVQTSALGMKYITMAFPIFDKDNNLAKVISFSNLMGEEEAEDKIEIIDYVKDEFFPELISYNSEIKNMVRICSTVDSPLFLYGEKGAGKENIARCIHKLSKRSGNVFYKLDALFMDIEELNNKLFGKEEFSEGVLSIVNGGTLYISNLSRIPYEIQNKLFYVIKDGGYTSAEGRFIPLNIRYIASDINKKSVEEFCENGCRHLYYLFHAIEIEIIPLRKRKNDLPLLIRFFSKSFEERYGYSGNIAPKAMKYLYTYRWPGNVGELKAFLENQFLNLENNTVNVKNLPDFIINNSSAIGNMLYDGDEIISLSEAVEQCEKNMIELALKQSKNAYEAAEKLQINPSTLTRKMQKYKISKRN